MSCRSRCVIGAFDSNTAPANCGIAARPASVSRKTMHTATFAAVRGMSGPPRAHAARQAGQHRTGTRPVLGPSAEDVRVKVARQLGVGKSAYQPGDEAAAELAACVRR